MTRGVPPFHCLMAQVQHIKAVDMEDTPTQPGEASLPLPENVELEGGASVDAIATSEVQASTAVAGVSPHQTALEGQIIKFKRLLALSRQRLEENQKQLAEKNQLIERLGAELEAARARAHVSRASSPTNALPRRALLRIHEGSTIWVLFEMDDEGDADPGPKWRSFRSEEDLNQLLRRVVGEPLRVPPPSLAPHASEQIREEAKQSVARMSEEFRKYRVRAELSLRQKEAEIKQLCSSSMVQQQHRIEECVDAEDLTRQVKAADARLTQLRAELQEQEQRWRGMYEKVVKENELLQGAGAETALAAQWRKRYEGVVREKEDLANRLDNGHNGGGGGGSTGMGMGMGMGMGPLSSGGGARSNTPPIMSTSTAEQKYLDVKQEYKLYRKKALEALREKDALIAEQAVMLGGRQPPSAPSSSSSSSSIRRSSGGANPAGGGGGGGGPMGGPPSAMLDVEGDPRIQYLRNLVAKYLSTEQAEIREPTERAICTVLRFSDDEMNKIKAGRVSRVGSGMAQWALPANLFGSSSSSSSS